MGVKNGDLASAVEKFCRWLSRSVPILSYEVVDGDSARWRGYAPDKKYDSMLILKLDFRVLNMRRLNEVLREVRKEAKFAGLRIVDSYISAEATISSDDLVPVLGLRLLVKRVRRR